VETACQPDVILVSCRPDQGGSTVLKNVGQERSGTGDGFGG
jgi:hypothetical protein